MSKDAGSIPVGATKRALEIRRFPHIPGDPCTIRAPLLFRFAGGRQPRAELRALLQWAQLFITFVLKVGSLEISLWIYFIWAQDAYSVTFCAHTHADIVRKKQHFIRAALLLKVEVGSKLRSGIDASIGAKETLQKGTRPAKVGPS